MPILTAQRFDDPRPELKKLRRGQLKVICREAGLEFEQTTATADDLRRMVSSNQIDVSKYVKHKLGAAEAASQAIQKAEDRNAVLEDRIEGLETKLTDMIAAMSQSNEKVSESEEFPESFEGLPIWRLRQLAKIAGLNCTKTDKAVVIIEKLNEYIADRRQ